MITNNIFQHRIQALDVPIDKKEVYRYLGFSINTQKKEFLPEIDFLIEKSIKEMHSIIHAQGLYRCFPLKKDDSKQIPEISFEKYKIQSTYLYKNLKNCSHVVLFAATIGPQVDALIRRYIKLDAAKAAILQATGAMFTESYVDILNQKISLWAKSEGFLTNRRFSPGYGDVDLINQKIFFSVLPCTQKIGLTLTDSLVMAPEKSVTGFIGLYKNISYS